MVSYYRATESTAKIKPVKSNFRKANDIANLALAIIREEGEISKKGLIKKFDLHRSNLGYSNSTFDIVLGYAATSLSKQRLIEILTFEQYIANGHLTTQQIVNYSKWLRHAGIMKGHGHQNAGEYTKEELKVFRKIGDYKSQGVSIVDAIKSSLREVLGEDSVKKFGEWYEQRVREHLAAFRASRRLHITSLIKQQKPTLVTIRDLDIYTTLYDDSKYRRNPKGKLMHVHNTLLERLVKDFSNQYAFSRQYPFNLYFKLSEKDPKAEIKNKIDALMQSTPTQNEFLAYENAIFRSPRASLDDSKSKLEYYLEEGFREAEQSIEALASITHRGRKSNFRKYLEIVTARYNETNQKRTLEEIGQEMEVWRETIRQLEAKGLALLRAQPAIQRLLSYGFWEIK